MKIDWVKLNGLLPVVVQDYADKSVLMMAYMNEEALNLTQKTGLAHYFSRSKNRIWQKGEESGNIQIVKEMSLDCDNDTLLLIVEQKGSACHTGNKTCFFNKFDDKFKPNLTTTIRPKYDILDELYHIALSRKFNSNKEKSYIARLYSKGSNAYLKKISEEANELCLAIKDLKNAQNAVNLGQDINKFGEHKKGDPSYDVVYEGADLIFHIIVALADLNIHPSQILDELKRREGISGIEEKNARSH